jgi:hypothetical protein
MYLWYLGIILSKFLKDGIGSVKYTVMSSHAVNLLVVIISNWILNAYFLKWGVNASMIYGF